MEEPTTASDELFNAGFLAARIRYAASSAYKIGYKAIPQGSAGVKIAYIAQARTLGAHPYAVMSDNWRHVTDALGITGRILGA